MKINLLLISTILLFISCANNTENKEVVIVESVIETLTLEFASKNPETTKNKEGTHVGVNEMLKLSLNDNTQMDFVGQVLTLNNLKEGALNFYIRNDSLFCNAPNSLMLMSMPPKPGIAPSMINENTEFFVNPMSLLKLESVNIMFIGIGSSNR
jgi:hypothetical protein|tara:strand:+ start:404 stop:865 length:462 start_codon:yes stop_codon:yes gene_type:complete